MTGHRKPAARRLYRLALCLLALLLPVCAQAQTRELANDPAQAEVRALLARLSQAYARKDMEALLKAAHPQAEVVVQSLLGTSSHKGRQHIRAAYGPELKAARSPSLEFTSLEVQAGPGKARVVAEVLAGAYVGGEYLRMPARLTALLEKQGGGWQVFFAQVRYPILRQDLERLLGN